MLLLLLLQVLASCLWLAHGEVVTSFKNSCPQFFFQKTPPNAALQPKNPAWICQCYNKKYQFATLYDRDLRIPVYSTYLYQPGSCKRPNTWLVEPQLINQTYPPDMETEQYVIQTLKAPLDQLNKSQAVLQDYENLAGLHRGHLNPCSHNDNTASCNATFTLTNIVPQNAKLNQGAWKRYELTTMKNKAQGCKTTYVLVGAVPGNTSISNRKVNKPSHMWASACCETNNNQIRAWGAIAENNNKNKVEVLTLGQLENKLTQLYASEQVSLFHEDCPRP